MAAKTGFITFADNEHVIRQPAANTSTDAAHPTTSFDFRADVDLDALVDGRVFAGIHNTTNASCPWRISNEAGATVRLTHSNATATTVNFAGTFFVAARRQYRILWSGTQATVYRRDPASFDLDLSDNTNWTQIDTQATANVNTITQVANSPFTLMERLVGIGWSAADWYEVQYYVDGVLELHIDGDTVTIDTGANTLDDVVQGADEWNWGASDDPTLTPPDILDTYGLADETDSAMPFEATAGVAVLDEYGFAGETDTAMAFSADTQLTDTYGFAASTETARPFTATAASIPGEFGSTGFRTFGRLNRCRCCTVAAESS